MVAGLGILIVALALVLVLVPAKKPSDKPPASINLKTYTNAEYGFSVQYPEGGIAGNGTPEGIHLEEDIDTGSAAGYISFPPVDTFSENGSHGHYQYQVRVYADTSDIVRQPCSVMMSILPMEQASGTTVVAGFPAQVWTGGDAAAGTHVSFTRYSLCAGNRYYSLIDLFASSSDGTPLTPKLKADIAAGAAINKQIVQSFKIVK